MFAIVFIAASQRRETLPSGPIDQQTFEALQKVEKASADFGRLLRELSTQTEQRVDLLRQLEVQRRLIELTPEQRQQLERLLNPPRTLGERLLSAELWFYGFLPNLVAGAMFFFLGMRHQKRLQRQQPS